MFKAPSGPAEAAGQQQPARSDLTVLGLSKWLLLPPPYPPEILWPLALSELKQQMTKATFNTWLVDSRVVPEASNPAFLVVAVRNQYAYEWLTYRLQPVIIRTLTGMTGHQVVVCFIPRTLRTMRRNRYEPARRPSTRISFPIRR